MRYLKKTFVAVLTGTMLLASCQKELSIENAKIPIKGLLIKTVAVTGTDTLTTIYTYDDRGRLETETTDGTSSGEQYHSFRRYVRDNNARVSNMLFMQVQSGVQYDTVRTQVHYPDATTLEFDYSIATQDYFGFPIRDSTVFTYSNDNMAQSETYMDVGMGYTLSEREEFTFNGQGNVELSNFYSSVSSPDGSLLHTAIFEYTYSAEPNYVWASDNAAQNYWFTGLPNTANVNVAHLEVLDQTGVAGDVIISTELEPGADGKPVTGVSTVMPYNAITTYTFYYQ